jgi:hypothetical protein
MMFSYDSDFSPPAPVLEITVHHPKTAGLETGVRAQLDPGSDISVLPESAAHAIGLQRNGELEVEGYDGLVAQRQGAQLRVERPLIAISSCSSPLPATHIFPRPHCHTLTSLYHGTPGVMTVVEAIFLA